MIRVDSSVWIDRINRVPSVQAQRLLRLVDTQPLLIGDLILCEVLQGIRSEAAVRLVERMLGQFERVTLCGPELAVQAARNYRLLRRRGITIRKTIDVIIATFCIERGHALLHRDRDFEPMERFLGLQTV